MSNTFYVNNIEPTTISFNNSVVKSLYYNNRLVWSANPNQISMIKFISTSSFAVTASGGVGWDGTMEYSKDGGTTWNTWTGAQQSAAKVNSEYVFCLRGTGNTKVAKTNSSGKCWSISGTAVRCTGNIEALLDYTTVEAGGHPTMAASCFRSLFYGCTKLIEAPDLPATTLSEYCYMNMFRGCTALAKGPKTLPATNLAMWCYGGMFQGCSALTTAPTLPATTLAEFCYQGMFQGCTSLTKAPTLPATNLADCCYQAMFDSCTGLTSLPVLPATTLPYGCYFEMFSYCTQLAFALVGTDACPYAFRIPSSGTAASVDDTALMSIFSPMLDTDMINANTTYYVNVPVI